MNDRARVRWHLISNILTVLGTGLLISIGFLSAYKISQQWLASQERQITTIRSPDIPILLPTAAPTGPAPSTPTSPPPTPTPTVTVAPSPPIRIVIPSIDVNQAIVEVEWRAIFRNGAAESEWITPAYVVGHHKTSASPGQGSNIVLNGHNNTLGQVFRRLPELSPGDEIFLYTFEREFVYIVKESKTVRAVGATAEERNEMAWLIGPMPEETLTLVSCWPYATYTHRIFVIAKPK